MGHSMCQGGKAPTASTARSSLFLGCSSRRCEGGNRSDGTEFDMSLYDQSSCPTTNATPWLFCGDIGGTYHAALRPPQSGKHRWSHVSDFLDMLKVKLPQHAKFTCAEVMHQYNPVESMKVMDPTYRAPSSQQVAVMDIEGGRRPIFCTHDWCKNPTEPPPPQIPNSTVVT
eukprot:1754555-Pleurochrysis_carterae.AAC.1